MDFLLDLIKNPVVLLILISVIAQVFSGDRAQKKARERAEKRRREAGQDPMQSPPAQRPTAQQGPLTDSEDIAERIKRMLGGEAGAPSAPPEPEPLESTWLPAPSGPLTMGTEDRDRIHEERLRQEELMERAQVALQRKVRDLPAGPADSGSQTAVLPDAIASRGGRPSAGRIPALGGLSAVDAIRAAIVLGPPRALASFDEDPLRSKYVRED